MYSGKSQSNRLSLTRAISLSWHRRLFRVRWRKLDVQAFFLKSLSIQTKPQNYFCAEQRSDGPREFPAIFEAAVILCFSAHGSGDSGTMSMKVWGSRSWFRQAWSWIWELPCCPGTAFSRSQLGSCCVENPSQELTGFLKGFFRAVQRCGSNQMLPIAFVRW